MATAPTKRATIEDLSAAEREMAEKRVDYFAAGTLVVWDVDPEDEVVHVYRGFDMRGMFHDLRASNPTIRILIKIHKTPSALPSRSIQLASALHRRPSSSVIQEAEIDSPTRTGASTMIISVMPDFWMAATINAPRNTVVSPEAHAAIMPG